MLSLAIVILSPSSPAISSSAGAIIRHGPHHSAQKSTRTGLSEPRTSLAKLWSVTVLVAMAGDSPGGIKHLMSIWAFVLPLSRHQFDEFRVSGVEQGCADPTSREYDLQRFDISHHLRAVGIRDLGFTPGHLAGLEINNGDAVAFDA